MGRASVSRATPRPWFRALEAKSGCPRTMSAGVRSEVGGVVQMRTRWPVLTTRRSRSLHNPVTGASKTEAEADESDALMFGCPRMKSGRRSASWGNRSQTRTRGPLPT